MSDCKEMQTGQRACTPACYKHLSDGYLRNAWQTCEVSIAPMLSLIGVTNTQIDTILASCKAHIAVPNCLAKNAKAPCGLPQVAGECQNYFSKKTVLLQSVMSYCKAMESGQACTRACYKHLSDGRLRSAWQTCKVTIAPMLSLIGVTPSQIDTILASCKAHIATPDCGVTGISTPTILGNTITKTIATTITSTTAATAATAITTAAKTTTTTSTLKTVVAEDPTASKNLLPVVIVSGVGVLVVAAAVIGVICWRALARRGTADREETLEQQPNLQMHRDLGRSSSGHLLSNAAVDGDSAMFLLDNRDYWQNNDDDEEHDDYTQL